MANSQTSETVTLTTSERTFRFEIEMPLGGVPFISGHREVVKSVGDMVIARDVIEPTRRFLSKVEQKAKIKQIMDMVSELIDGWRAEDIAHEAKIAPLRELTNRPKPPAP